MNLYSSNFLYLCLVVLAIYILFKKDKVVDMFNSIEMFSTKATYDKISADLDEVNKEIEEKCSADDGNDSREQINDGVNCRDLNSRKIALEADKASWGQGLDGEASAPEPDSESSTDSPQPFGTFQDDRYAPA
jgi:hypothetical protein